MKKRSPWANDNITRGFAKGTRFEILKDSFLYRYYDEYSLVPESYTSFSIEDFQMNPDLGSNPDSTAKYEKVIPKGAIIRFTKIRFKNDYLIGDFGVPLAVFEDESIFDEEVAIPRMFSSFGFEFDGENLKPLENKKIVQLQINIPNQLPG